MNIKDKVVPQNHIHRELLLLRADRQAVRVSVQSQENSLADR